MYFYANERTGLTCDLAKLSAVRNWHASDKVKAVRQFVGFVGYYRRLVQDFAELAEQLVVLTRKGAPFVWTDQQTAFEACLICAPILDFPSEDGRFLLDRDVRKTLDPPPPLTTPTLEIQNQNKRIEDNGYRFQLSLSTIWRNHLPYNQ